MSPAAFQVKYATLCTQMFHIICITKENLQKKEKKSNVRLYNSNQFGCLPYKKKKSCFPEINPKSKSNCIYIYCNLFIYLGKILA